MQKDFAGKERGKEERETEEKFKNLGQVGKYFFNSAKLCFDYDAVCWLAGKGSRLDYVDTLHVNCALLLLPASLLLPI